MSDLQREFEYLDALRESGRTNMFGAPQFMQDELGMDKIDAVHSWKIWMKTFDGVTPLAERIKQAMEQI